MARGFLLGPLRSCDTQFMFTFAAWLVLMAAHGSPLDPCSRWLALSEGVPEIYEDSHWRSRRHLTAARGGRAVVLERETSVRNAIQLYSIAVPVYREFSNGNLGRLLGQIARQTVPATRVHVVLLINNSIQVALNANDPTLIENKRTVAWLRQIRDQLPFRLAIIDETRGIDRVMGPLRNRAIHHALTMTDVNPRHHVIINLDADITLTPDYLERLGAYYDHFAVDAVIARRGHTLPRTVDALHYRIMGVSEFGHVNHDVSNVADFPNRGYVTPQITARASAFHDLGGFGYVDFEEDFDFGKRLGGHTLVMAPDVYVAQSDRARADGFAAAKRAKLINQNLWSEGQALRGRPKTAPVATHAAKALEPFVTHLRSRVNDRRLSGFGALIEFETVARRFFHRDDLDSLLTDELGRGPDSFRWDEITRRLTARPIDPDLDFASYLLKTLSAGLRGAERRRFENRLEFHRAFERASIRRRLTTLRKILHDDRLEPARGSDIFEDQLRERSSSLRRDIDARLRRRRLESANHDQPITSEDTLLELLVQRYPDFLDESLSDPWVVQNQALRFLNDWFLRARLHPEDYPGTADFLSLRPAR